MSAPDKLDTLLEGLIDALQKRIENGDASPADLNVARQLLKDNNVGFTKKHPGAKALVENLPFDPNEPDDFDAASRPN